MPPVAGMVIPLRLSLGFVGKGGYGREELLMETVGNTEGPFVELVESVGNAEGLVVAFL